MGHKPEHGRRTTYTWRGNFGAQLCSFVAVVGSGKRVPRSNSAVFQIPLYEDSMRHCPDRWRSVGGMRSLGEILAGAFTVTFAS